MARVSGDVVVAQYRAAGYYRWALLLGLLIVVSILVWIWTAAASLSAAVFGCLLAALPLGWLVCGFGFRIADRLALTDTELVWFAPLARGTVPLSSVRSMADALPFVDALRISVAGSRPLYVRVGGGLREFEHRAASLAPHIRVSVSRRQEHVETWGSDGYSDGP